MRAGETVYYLEMRAATQVRPVGVVPADLVLLAQPDPVAVRDVTLAIGRPYDWPSQHWDARRWAKYLGDPDLRHWSAQRAGRTVGLASLRFGPQEVELDTFGLVPEHVGQGLGIAFLTLVAQLAWREAPGARRVWLHTSSQDHPRALKVYQRCGFRLYARVKPGDT